MQKDELIYYGRQMRLPEIGSAGQERLKRSSILLIGLGGLGSPLALYLAAAGIGRIGVVEFDQIDASNLHRQILYDSSQVGRLKLECGVARIRALNPFIQVEAHPVRFSATNARALVSDYDVVADGADNFSTRYLVNDACVLEGKPLVSASILGFEGQLSVFGYDGGPCYRCLYPAPPPAGAVPSCAEAGVLGALPGVMGSLQACEALKILLRTGDVVSGRLVHFDALTMTFSDLRFQRAGDCAICGPKATIRDVVETVEACETTPEITAEELAARLKAGTITLIDVREAEERAESSIPGSVHMPLRDVLSFGLSFPFDCALALHCRSGARSARGVASLRARGFTNVVNLRGGISAWGYDDTESDR